MTITRDDIEAKARQLVGSVDETRESVKDKALLAGAGVVGLILFAFWMGGRRSRKSKSVVEVYKV